MNRKVPLWVLALLLLFGVFTTVMFGWSVRHVVGGYDRLGSLGPIVEKIASLPELAQDSLYATGILSKPVFDDETGEMVRLPKQIISSPFPGLTGFYTSGTYPPGAENDPGYLLVPAFNIAKGQSTTKLIRISDGHVIHEWVPDLPIGNPETYEMWHPLLLNNGNLLFHWHADPILEIDICGDKVWESKAQYHHSLERDSDGTIWLAKHGDQADFPKLYQYQDAIITGIRPGGEVIFERSVTDLLIKNGYEALLLGMSIYTGDQIHLNDIQPALYSTEYWKKGDLLLSFRELSSVMLYRPSSDEIIWMKTGPWIRQHDPDFLGESMISVFGNDYVRGNTLGQSLIRGHNDIYVYDFETGSISQPFSTVLRDANVATHERGLHQILDDGTVIVEESNRGRILRLSQQEVIWEYTPQASEETVAMPTWSRYLTQDQAVPVLNILTETICNDT